MSKESAFEVGRLYGPIKTIADTLTASQKDVFVRLPGLIAYWPMGIRDIAGNVRDHSGAGSTLPETGSCPVGYDGNSFTHLGNGTNYLSSPTGFGVTGLETWISSSIRGLTLGGWFMVDALPASQAGLVTKFGVVTNYGYAMNVLSTGVIQVLVSPNGSSVFFVDSLAIQTGQWVFLVARFTPSTEVAVFVNADKSANETAIPSSLNVSSQDFEIGRYQGNNSLIVHGKTRDVFVCASALSDALIEEVRSTSVP